MNSAQMPKGVIGTAAAVCEMFTPPISRVTLWRMVNKDSDFPRPIYLPSTGPKKTKSKRYWDMAEVTRYFESLKARRDLNEACEVEAA
jgi:predicted DNA-binding transcriptional regulator AlpA